MIKIPKLIKKTISKKLFHGLEYLLQCAFFKRKLYVPFDLRKDAFQNLIKEPPSA